MCTTSRRIKNLFYLETEENLEKRDRERLLSLAFSSKPEQRNSKYRNRWSWAKSRFHSPSKLDLAARGGCKFRNLPLPASTCIRSQTKRQFSKLLVPNPTDIHFMYPLSSMPFSPGWFRRSSFFLLPLRFLLHPPPPLFIVGFEFSPRPARFL